MNAAISALRERATLQRPDRAADAIGGASLAWTDVATVWAQIESLSGSLREAFDGAASTQRYAVTLRARSDVRADWRVIWNSRTLRVLSVAPAPNARLVLACEEERL